jgi:hypothetical protein
MPQPRFTPGKGPPVPIEQEAGWVGPRASLDAEARRKILCLCWGSNPSHPVRGQTQNWPSFPSSQCWEKNLKIQTWLPLSKYLSTLSIIILPDISSVIKKCYAHRAPLNTVINNNIKSVKPSHTLTLCPFHLNHSCLVLQGLQLSWDQCLWNLRSAGYLLIPTK